MHTPVFESTHLTCEYFVCVANQELRIYLPAYRALYILHASPCQWISSSWWAGTSGSTALRRNWTQRRRSSASASLAMVRLKFVLKYPSLLTVLVETRRCTHQFCDRCRKMDAEDQAKEAGIASERSSFASSRTSSGANSRTNSY